MKIEVTRAFYPPAVRPAGDRVECDDRLAAELIHNGKARPATEPAPEENRAAPERNPMSQFNFASGATVLHLSARPRRPAPSPAAAVDLLDYEGGVAIVQSHGTGTGTSTARSRIPPTDRPAGPMSRRCLHASTTTADVRCWRSTQNRSSATSATSAPSSPARRTSPPSSSASRKIGLMLTTVERGFFVDFGTAATIGAATVTGIFDAPTAETFGMLGTDPTFTCAAADVPESPQARPSPSTPWLHSDRRQPDGTGVTVLDARTSRLTWRTSELHPHRHRQPPHRPGDDHRLARHPSRIHPLADANLPCLRVYLDEEEIVTETIHADLLLDRAAVLRVECCAKAVSNSIPLGHHARRSRIRHCWR